jgi:hypothetical protein
MGGKSRITLMSFDVEALVTTEHHSLFCVHTFLWPPRGTVTKSQSLKFGKASFRVLVHLYSPARVSASASASASASSGWTCALPSLPSYVPSDGVSMPMSQFLPPQPMHHAKVREPTARRIYSPAQNAHQLISTQPYDSCLAALLL